MRVAPKGDTAHFPLHLDDLDEPGGFVAAAANRANDKKLQKELDRLFD